MTPVRQAEKRYCSMAITCAIFVGFSLLIFALKPLAKGLILGTLFSILNFILMGESISGRLDPSAKMASFRALRFILFRYVLLALPLIAAIKFKEDFNLWTVVVGLFMVQLMILADHVRGLFYSTDTTRKNALWKN